MNEPQNIYDDPRFFAGYSTLERFGAGWTGALEQPLFLGLLPEVAGARVLDLGCGAGQLSYHLAQSGAAEVIGVDVSETMLGLARAERSHPRVTFSVAAMESLRFPAERFDLVVSSLALHYVADYVGLVRRVADWLVPGGGFVFSTEHPIYTARLPGDGWLLDEHGRRSGWRIDAYFDEGMREERWFVEGVHKYHRTLATLVNGLLDAGLRVDRVVEPAPSQDRLRRRPHERDELRRPMFLLVRSTRP